MYECGTFQTKAERKAKNNAKWMDFIQLTNDSVWWMCVYVCLFYGSALFTSKQLQANKLWVLLNGMMNMILVSMEHSAYFMFCICILNYSEKSMKRHIHRIHYIRYIVLPCTIVVVSACNWIETNSLTLYEIFCASSTFIRYIISELFDGVRRGGGGDFLSHLIYQI